MKDREGKTSSNLSAFGYLYLIEQAVLVRDQKNASQPSDKKGWMGLMFLSGHSVLMTPLEEVIGIVPVAKMSPVPKVKPWVLGMSTFRSEIFPVTDLAGMLSQKLSTITRDSRVLIIATQDEYSGLLVNRVLGLQRVTDQHSIEKLPEGLMAEYKPFVVGAIINERFQLPIISCKLIVRHPLFKDVILREKEI